MKKFISVSLWILGFFGSHVVLNTIFPILFADSPSFEKNLTDFQNLVFNVQFYFLLGLPLLFWFSFIIHFFQKTIPWNWIAFTIGILGIVYTCLFFVAFSKGF